MLLSPRAKVKKLRNPSCKLCPLHEGKDNVCVMGDGLYKLPVFVVGEAPGYQEDKYGKPFVGQTGKLLRSELLKVGLNPSSLYLTNVAKCFPEGTPSEEEARICSNNYLRREIEILNPAFILALGQGAYRILVPGEERIGKARGQLQRGHNNQPVFVTWHPSYVLRNKRELPTFREDLAIFAAMLRLDFGYEIEEGLSTSPEATEFSESESPALA